MLICYAAQSFMLTDHQLCCQYGVVRSVKSHEKNISCQYLKCLIIAEIISLFESLNPTCFIPHSNRYMVKINTVADQ